MSVSKMDYKNSLETFLKIYSPSEKVDKNGLDLISNLLNEVNSILISNIGAEYDSTGKIKGQTFENLAQNAINENFPGELKTFAISEANRQLALLKNGCIVYAEEDTEVIGQEQVGILQTEDGDAQKQIKRSYQRKIEPKAFIKGIGKISAEIVPKFKVDGEAINFLALGIQKFNNLVAERASEKFRQNEELQPENLKPILAEYFGPNVLKSAMDEGNRCLSLYENGLLAFKPRKTAVSGAQAKIKPSRKKTQLTDKPKKRKTSKSPKHLTSSKKRKSKSPSKGTRIKKPSKKTGTQKKLTSVRPRKVAKVKKPSRKSPEKLKVTKKRKTSKMPKRPPSPKKRRSKSLSTRKNVKKPPKKIGTKKKLTSVISKKIAQVKKPGTKLSRKSPQRLKVSKKRQSSKTPKRLLSSKKRESSKTPKRPLSSKKRKSKYLSKSTRRKRPSKKTGTQKKSTSVRSKEIAKVKKPSRKSPQSLKVPKKRKPSKMPKRPPSPKKRISKSLSKSSKLKKPAKKIGTKKKLPSVRPKKIGKVKTPSIKPSRKSPQRLKVPKKRKPSKMLKRPPSPKKRRSRSPSTSTKVEKPSKKTTELPTFAMKMVTTALKAFSNVNVNLADETENYIKGIVADVYQELVATVSHALESDELDIRSFEAALIELFPRELANHALSVALT